MFEQLDDPVGLPPSTREQRQATLRRGASLRRRRRTKMIAGAAAAVAAAIVGTFALSPSVTGNTTVPPVAASPSASIAATPSSGPGQGTVGFWGSDPEVFATVTLPAGWEADGWVTKSDSDARTGVVFVDVGNVFTDGCTWEQVEPRPGPTVDDLVAAFAKVPKSGAARDVAVDGFKGKQIEWTTPDYDEHDCIEGKFGIVQEDGFIGRGPNLWAQSPNQQNRIRILDVGGIRLTIITTNPPDISAQDRAELEAVVNSVRIR